MDKKVEKQFKEIWKEMDELTDNLTAIAKSIKKQDEIISSILSITKGQTTLIKQNLDSIENLLEIVKKLGKVPKVKKEFYVA